MHAPSLFAGRLHSVRRMTAHAQFLTARTPSLALVRRRVCSPSRERTPRFPMPAPGAQARGVQHQAQALLPPDTRRGACCGRCVSRRPMPSRQKLSWAVFCEVVAPPRLAATSPLISRARPLQPHAGAARASRGSAPPRVQAHARLDGSSPQTNTPPCQSPAMQVAASAPTLHAFFPEPPRVKAGDAAEAVPMDAEAQAAARGGDATEQPSAAPLDDAGDARDADAAPSPPDGAADAASPAAAAGASPAVRAAARAVRRVAPRAGLRTACQRSATFSRVCASRANAPADRAAPTPAPAPARTARHATHVRRPRAA
jgi:hypothetical protein